MQLEKKFIGRYISRKSTKFSRINSNSRKLEDSEKVGTVE